MNSKVYSAQDQLKAQIVTQATSIGVSVFIGAPARPQDECIWVSGEVDDWNQTFALTGLKAKDEIFTLRVHCLTTRIGEYVDARDRAKTLGEIVEDAVSADYTLGGTVQLAEVSGAVLEEAMVDERRRQALLTLLVKCRAWVS